MERLIFRNAIGQEIEFSATSTYKWLDVDNLGEMVARSQTTSSPFQDGETPVGLSYFNSKIVSVDFVIQSDSPFEALRQLNSVINPKVGVGSLIYEINGVQRVYNKVKTRIMPSIPRSETRGDNFIFSSISIEIYDPYFTDSTFSEQTVTTSALYFSFPLNITETYEFDTFNVEGITVTNAGDVECPVEISIQGAVTQPLTIENTTTGEKIVIALDIAEGSTLTITTEIDNINVTIDDGSMVESAFQYIDIAQTTFFNLAKGENVIILTGNEGDVESATLKFKNRYVGV